MAVYMTQLFLKPLTHTSNHLIFGIDIGSSVTTCQ